MDGTTDLPAGGLLGQEAKAAIKACHRTTLKEKADNIRSSLPDPQRRAMELAREKGGSSTLTTIPIVQHGFFFEIFMIMFIYATVGHWITWTVCDSMCYWIVCDSILGVILWDWIVCDSCFVRQKCRPRKNSQIQEFVILCMNDEAVYTTLGRRNTPVPQGNTVAASTEALKEYVASVVMMAIVNDSVKVQMPVINRPHQYYPNVFHKMNMMRSSNSSSTISVTGIAQPHSGAGVFRNPWPQH